MTGEGTGGSRVGSTIGPYVLHEEIGRGGMGVVYRATRADTGLEVAIKLMLPELSSNLRFRERFIAEVHTAPKLDHPNIVPIHEAGEVSKKLYIAMRLVDGVDLKQLIERDGRLTPQRVIAILRQVGSALDYAHGVGVVHRDVKPQNILMSAANGSEEVVYITDFGLVKPAGSESTASRTGEVFGSIQYMAPEQVEGMPTDGRADVYSLGCVAFETLTGRIPFDRPNEVAVLWAHVHEDPPRASAVAPGLQGGLDIAVASAMAKHPDDRYLTCGEFVEALEQGLAKTPRSIVMPVVRPLVERIPRKKTEREVWAPNFFPELSRVRAASRERFDWRKATALVAAVAALSSVQVGREGGLPKAVADVADAAGSVGEQVFDAAFDKGAVAGDEVRDGSGKDRNTVLEAERAIARENHDQLPLAPAPATNGHLGGSEQVTNPAGDAGSLEPLIAYSSPNGVDNFEIYVARPDGSDRRQLTNNGLDDLNPQWSPDGSKILFETVASGGSGDIVSPTVSDLYVIGADGSGLTRLTNDTDWEGEPAWSPDGRRIVFSERPNVGSDTSWITVMNVDGTGQRRLTAGDEPEWSPDGRWIAYRHDGRIWITKADGTAATQVTSGRGIHGDPAWAPDGSRIAFVRWNPGDDVRQLVLVDPLAEKVGASQRNITVLSSQRYSSPDWTPDGRFVIYTLDWDLYRIKPDGTGNQLLIDSPSGHRIISPVWRPNSHS